MAHSRTAAAAALVALVALAFGLSATLSACGLPNAATPTPAVGTTPTSAPTSAATSAATPTPTSGPLPTLTFGPTAAGGVEDAFAKYLAALPTDALQSGVDALAQYKVRIGAATAALNLDAVFGDYLGFEYALGFGLMNDFSALDAARKADKAKFDAGLAAAGLVAVDVDGSFVIEPDFQVIQAQLSAFLTPIGEKYCLMMVANQDNPVVLGYSELNVSLAAIGDTLADWDALVLELGGHAYPPTDSMYKGQFVVQEIRRGYQLDLLSYDIYANMPMFDANDVLTQDFRDAYSAFLAKHPDTESAQLVSDYVAALESHGWKRNAEATAVLTAAGLAYLSTEQIG